MSVLMMTIPVTFTMVLLFMLFFVTAARRGQFDDLETPAHAPLSDDEKNYTTENKTEAEVK